MRNSRPVPANAPVTAATLCQRCLQSGHWTADCKNEPVYKSRPSRTARLYNANIKLPEQQMKNELTDLKDAEEDRRKVLEQVLNANAEATVQDFSSSDFSE